jgi:phage terminase large subunit-like protein
MRKNASKATLTQAEIRQQLIQQANLASEKFKDSEYAEEFADEVTPNVRSEISPPAKPDRTRFNPDQIVDIVTFIEHPYFCNLKPYPLQRLILKCFYMGQEGNTDLVIQDIPEEERIGCDGCVWDFVKKNEHKSVEMNKQNRPFKASFSVINSPCLTCDRMDKDIIQQRFEHEKDNATNPDALKKIEQLLERPFIDNFQTEKDLLYSEEFDPKLRMQIMDKCTNRYKFQELVLVLGRRSGKSFLVSAIGLYELYRLISMGHPQARYGLMEFDAIYLLNVAKNEEQAKNAIFAKLKQTVLASPFFQPYIGKDTELEMRFFTENDRKENERRETAGLNLFSGSLVLKCGSSSASGLVGLTCWSVIMDEIAAMAGDNPDSGLDYDLYNDLKPSLATFGRDGKMMMLSNPKGPIGLLYDLHENRQDDPSTLVMRGPTWLVNPNIDRDFLESEKKKNPTEYQMQYGAEFGASSSDPMFTEDDVNRFFSSMSMIKRLEMGTGMFEYYCHIDPARTSDYYALAVAHCETMYGQYGKDSKPLRRVVIDHIHFWNPKTKNQPVSEKDVEDYVLSLHAKFRFKQVSIDQWNSQSSVIKLRNMRVPIIEKTFNKNYKESIYTELATLLREDRIDIYDLSGGEYTDLRGNKMPLEEIKEAKIQFLFLQKKWKGNRFIIESLKGYKDDICDAVAAVAYEAYFSKIAEVLPRSRTINLGGRIK